jgi:type VII secretion-associated serine protease mycosin
MIRMVVLRRVLAGAAATAAAAMAVAPGLTPAAPAAASAWAAAAAMSRASGAHASPTPRPTGSGKHKGGKGSQGKHTSPTPGLPQPVAVLPKPTSGCHPQTPSISRIGKQPWAQRAMALASVWRLTRGSGVTVALVDSGVDYSPQLAGRVTAISLRGGGLADCVGHGTALAGIIAAADLRTKGDFFTGVAPDARILSVKVNQGTTSNAGFLAQGIMDAARLGARVINVSSTTQKKAPVLRAAVRFALTQNAVIVAAGGNDTTDTSGHVSKGPFYPAAYPFPGVISVGAVTSGGGLASFSDQRSNVAVTAPGLNLASTWPGGYLTKLAGTSYSTAFVSGVAALVISRYPHMTAAQVAQRIEATADGQTGPGTGNGLVNPLQAVTAVLPAVGAGGPAPPASPALVPVATPPAPPRLPVAAALTVTGGAIAAAFAVAMGAVVISRGRRRHWRAARAEVPAEDDA